MRRSVRAAAVAVVVIGLAKGNVFGQEPERQTGTGSTVADLWQKMHEAGMITAEDYQHALEHGSLPTSGTRETQVAKTPRTGREPAGQRNELAPAARRERAQVRLQAFATRMRDKYAPQREAARDRARALGIPVRQELPSGHVAELDYFDEQGFPQVNQTENAVSADTISTDEVWPGGGNGFSLTGSPVILGIWDGGAVRATHTEFGSRITQQDNAMVVYGISSHATAVAGTMAAAGSYYSPSRGMSYAASVHAYDWDNYLSELASSATNGVLESNHSYGWIRGWYWKESESKWYWYGNPTVSQVEDHRFGLYDAEAQDRDEFVYSSLYCLPVWSAGNDRSDAPASQPVLHKVWVGYWADSTTVRNADGYDSGFDTIASRKTAQNILTIGAVADIVGGYTQPSDVAMSSFSCFGPTDDGRIKPDVVANGVGLHTPGGSGDYSYFQGNISGTSFSAPSVSGSLGLLQQLHEQLHGANQPLLTSTYKGLVIHTADEAGSNQGPDYRFGWGLMNTFAAAQLMTNNAAYNSKPHIKEVSLPDGEQVLFHVAADTSMPLRVTLCWTDPPGPLPPQYQLDPTNLVLVNDLDLRVIAPNGTTNYPWVLAPSNPTNAATTGDNIRDNVEQVHIENTTTGLYAVVVSHKGVLTNGVQDASILLSGNLPEDIDIIFTEIALTSGASRVEWVGAVGSIHTVMSSTNLLETNGWSVLSDDISVIHELTEWIDEGSTNAAESCRFYSIQEIK
jgi:hypothetical protein